MKMGQIRPLLIYFNSFHNAKTNIAKNLTIFDKRVAGAEDSNPWQQREGADESTELWAHPMLQLLCKRASFVEKPKIILSLFVVITTTYLLFLFSIVFGYHKSCKCLVITFN